MLLFDIIRTDNVDVLIFIAIIHFGGDILRTLLGNYLLVSIDEF